MTQFKLEGNGAQRLLQLFGSTGAETPLKFMLATIVTPPPSISIRIDGDTDDTPSEGIVVAEYLTEHKRTISYTSGTVSGNVDGYHGPGNLTSLSIIDGDLTIHCDLKAGDRVIVAIADDGQLVYVLDKAVI